MTRKGASCLSFTGKYFLDIMSLKGQQEKIKQSSSCYRGAFLSNADIQVLSKLANKFQHIWNCSNRISRPNSVSLVGWLMCTTLAMDLHLSLTTTRRWVLGQECSAWSEMEIDWKVLGNDQEAKKAIREMNGATIAGQEIKVKRSFIF